MHYFSDWLARQITLKRPLERPFLFLFAQPPEKTVPLFRCSAARLRNPEREPPCNVQNIKWATVPENVCRSKMTAKSRQFQLQLSSRCLHAYRRVAGFLSSPTLSIIGLSTY